MSKHFCLLILVLLLLNEIVGKNVNDTKSIKDIRKKTDNRNGKIINDRGKRSLHDIEKSFLTKIEQRLENENLNNLAKYEGDETVSNFENEPPFWGTRGRRDSSSENPEYIIANNKDVKCKSCDKYFGDFHKNVIKEEIDPFWFEGGIKSWDKTRDFNIFWDGRKHETEPFWGNRGKRDEMEPFWGNRGRRDEMEPFWGNRGRRDEIEPFWGNRGRRDETEPFWGNRGRRDETEPFWGNRGRRDESEPFWGNRGRRDENEPFWGNRGRRQDNEPFWGNRGRRETLNSLHDSQESIKPIIKQQLIKAMDNIKNGMDNLAKLRKKEEGVSFWNNRGRNNKLENLFTQPTRNRNTFLSNRLIPSKSNRPLEQKTILDERMYAEQPHYILIERSSRSSAEDDPFFISRGKKYTNFKLFQGIRGRRGVLEELVKSVRTDPYYIARGKKDTNYIKIGNSTILNEKFVKAKELICSTIDLLDMRNEDQKVKRNVDESERDRRTILKKLAAQLQMDPYFVSRGKKNGETDVNLEEFINHVSDLCN